MRRVLNRFCVTAIVLAIAFSSTAFAIAQQQGHLINEGQSAERVIKLQSSGASTQVTPATRSTTSRSVQPMSPTQSSKAPTVQFDEIQPGSVPQVLSTPGISPRRASVNSTLQQAERVQKQSVVSKPGVQPFVPFDPVQAKQNADWDATDVQTAEAADAKRLTVTNQTPEIETQIESPRFINLNRTATLRVRLQNVGDVTARNVKLVATLPSHAKFARALPSPTRSEGQELEFVLSNVGKGQSREVAIDLVPTRKAPLDIATQITVENAQRISLGVREPQLRLRIDGPSQANIGQEVRHQLVIENTGDGVANEIRLKTKFPEGIQPLKTLGEITVPDLQPGRSMVIDIDSQAHVPGEAELTAVASSLGVESQTAKTTVTVYQPELEISAIGPKMNFVNREGIYSIKLSNTGEVDVTNVNIMLQMPTGMKVTTISREASVDPESGMLIWTFDNIAAKTDQQIQLKTLAVSQGIQVCNIAVRSNETREKDLRLSTNIATRAELAVSLKNQTGPVQVGGQAQFLVTVENKGSSSASDIALNIELPKSLKPLNETGVDIQESGSVVAFRDGSIEPGQKREFVFSAVGLEQGEHVVRSVLQTKGTQHRIITEGSIYVYETSEARVSEALTPNVPHR